MALQEVRLTIDAQKVATEELNARGWSVLWGKAQPIRTGTVKSVMDARQEGVGVAFSGLPHSGSLSSIGEALYENWAMAEYLS